MGKASRAKTSEEREARIAKRLVRQEDGARVVAVRDPDAPPVKKAKLPSWMFPEKLSYLNGRGRRSR